MASRRAPNELVTLAAEIGPSVEPVSLADAPEADIVFLAFLFARHAEIAEAGSSWRGETVVNVTNASGVAVESLNGLPSSAWIARGLQGGRLMKGFDHFAKSQLSRTRRFSHLSKVATS